MTKTRVEVDIDARRDYAYDVEGEVKIGDKVRVYVDRPWESRRRAVIGTVKRIGSEYDGWCGTATVIRDD